MLGQGVLWPWLPGSTLGGPGPKGWDSSEKQGGEGVSGGLPGKWFQMGVVHAGGGLIQRRVTHPEQRLPLITNR